MNQSLNWNKRISGIRRTGKNITKFSGTKYSSINRSRENWIQQKWKWPIIGYENQEKRYNPINLTESNIIKILSIWKNTTEGIQGVVSPGRSISG